ncbi:hypothetical protein JL722_13496 [Aureococcus anophagefferens]|nr:hypothetical protein JL722_13496 [Aureococcus anophagefferens]
MACPSSTCRPSPDQLNLLRHRGPAFGGEMWRHQRLAASRRKRVAFGQRLYNVNEAMEQDDDDDGGPGPVARRRATRGRAKKGGGGAGSRERGGGGSGIGALQFRGAFEATDAAGDFDEKFSKLANTRLHFGASIALQSLVTNDVVTVKNSSDAKVDGTVVASPCADIEARDVALLKMIEMEDPGSYKGVRFGDDVWLQIFGGTGEPSWKNGSVVGAKVHTATKLPTVPLDPTQAKYRVEADAPASPASHGSPGGFPGAGGDPGSPTPNSHASVKLGAPTPVRATLPKGKDDAAWSFHEMRMRNVAALTLGRWRIMPATEELAKAATKRGGYVCNFDHGESTAGYKVERRGIWKLRVAEASTNLREMSKGEQRSEMLMDRARKCLALSDANRYGRRRYRSDTGEVERPGAVVDADADSHISGGIGFSTVLRESVFDGERQEEAHALRPHRAKERRPHEYFLDKFPRIGPGAEPPERPPKVSGGGSVCSASRASRRGRGRDGGDAAATVAASLSSRGGSSSQRRRLGSLSTALSSITYGPEWHVPKADLLINRQTTTSKIRFPPPSQRKRPAAAFDADAAAAAKARDHDGATVQRKSRLLGAAASWSYSLGDEDRTVAEVAANANLSARNAIQTLSSVWSDAGSHQGSDGGSHGTHGSSLAGHRRRHHHHRGAGAPLSDVSASDDDHESGLSDLEEPEHADIPSPHKLAMQDDEEEDTERLALEAIDAWHKKWTHRLSTDGRSGGPVVDRLEGEDVFLAHNIDYLKRRHRFKTMFAKLQIDSSADQVIYGKKAKAKDGASRDLLEDPPADMAVFEEEESLGAFMGDGALLKEMTLSTLGLLRDSVANNLNAAMVVAPRMRFVAVRLRDHLFGAANMAPDDASDVADEDLASTVSAAAAGALSVDALLKHAKKLHSEIMLFCTHVARVYAPKDDKRRKTRRGSSTKRMTRRQSSAKDGPGSGASTSSRTFDTHTAST